jgi:arginase
MKSLKMIGAGLGVGGFNHASNDAPVYFQRSSALNESNIDFNWLKIIDERAWLTTSSKTLPPDERLNIVHAVNSQIAELISELTQQQQRFCVIGGDHSCAIGTWESARNKSYNLPLNF